MNIHNIHEYELVSDGYFERLKLNNEQAVGDYLSRLSEDRQHHANLLAYDLQDTTKPLAHTVAIIPVAAHQEAANILPAMAEFAKQAKSEPFTVVLYPNAPFTADTAATEQTHQAILEAQSTYPQLDLRTTLLNTFDKATIGELRANIWNAVTLLAHHEGAFVNGNDVIALNTDIDLARLNPHFIRNIQQHIQPQINSGTATTGSYWVRAKHAYDPTLPNASRVAFVRDFAFYQLQQSSTYEAGLVVTLSSHARAGGFQSATTHETKPLTKPVRGIIPRTILETSPRRYAQRLSDVPDLQSIWNSDFTSTDNCRTAELCDISLLTIQKTMFNSLDFIMAHFYDTQLKQLRDEIHGNTIEHRSNESEELLQKYLPPMTAKRKLAERVITRVLGHNMGEYCNTLMEPEVDVLRNYIQNETLTRDIDKIVIEIKPAKPERL